MTALASNSPAQGAAPPVATTAPSSARSGFHKTLMWLHTWVGLTFGFALLFLAVTGGVLVMRPHFEDALNRRLVSAPACAAPLALDDLAARARAAHPEDKVGSIEINADAASSIAVKFNNKDYVYLDPCSGRVLGQQNQYGGLFGVIDGLHRFRFIDNGRKIGGTLSAITLVFLVIGGVYLWWPRSRRALKGALTFNARSPGIGRTLSLHKVVGVYAAALLLAMTITALPLSFDWAKNLIVVATGTPADSAPPPEAAAGSAKLHAGVKGAARAPGQKAKRLKMQDLWALAKADVPTLKWASIKYPKKDGVVEVEILERGMPHANAKSFLYLDAATGQTLRLSHYLTDTTLGRKVYLYILALHSGLVGGLPYQLALMLVCFSVPVQAYSGFSPYIRKQFRKSAKAGLSLKLVAKTVEAENICSFEFADARGRPLPAFSAGSHIDLTVGPGLIRQFSLCNDPKETHRYLIAVLREPQSRGGSRTLHDALEVGDVLEASLPKNHFQLAHAAGRSILIAGGIGITPILCMAERLSNIGAAFELHYAVASTARAAFVDRLEQAAFAQQVKLYVSDERRRLDTWALLRDVDPDAHVYVCGPERLIDDVLAAARALGWPDANVHCEYFVAEAHDTSNDRDFDVRLASTGLTIHVPRTTSVAAALASHGVDIPMSCSEGVCGTCLTRVLQGEVAHRDRVLSAAERARGDQFTPCCSRATGPLLVLDL
ncbi:MAG: hypothetical protein JWP28_1881 [Phenylobacterium sp.]|uniref:PepSY domain-containing protein n=1 Tax=Phenylobacterium sp. TaxID=1871053 RepID=UPI00261C5F9A|nr:PepSY domain-containing protein [Phenylobacterium sp.]MDB5497850.1 hypothetical protein [Phenylobacterium sp.]